MSENALAQITRNVGNLFRQALHNSAEPLIQRLYNYVQPLSPEQRAAHTAAVLAYFLRKLPEGHRIVVTAELLDCITDVVGASIVVPLLDRQRQVDMEPTDKEVRTKHGARHVGKRGRA